HNREVAGSIPALGTTPVTTGVQNPHPPSTGTHEVRRRACHPDERGEPWRARALTCVPRSPWRVSTARRATTSPRRTVATPRIGSSSRSSARPAASRRRTARPAERTPHAPTKATRIIPGGLRHARGAARTARRAVRAGLPTRPPGRRDDQSVPHPSAPADPTSGDVMTTSPDPSFAGRTYPAGPVHTVSAAKIAEFARP